MNITGTNPGFQMSSFMRLSATDIFGLITSISAAVMLAQTVWDHIIGIIPKPVQTRIHSLLCRLFKFRGSDITITVDQYDEDGTENQVYEAAKVYLPTKVKPNTSYNLRLSQTPGETKPSVSIGEEGEDVVDTVDNIPLTWRYVCEQPSEEEEKYGSAFEKRYFVLTCPSTHKDVVLNSSYASHVIAQANAIKENQKVIKIHGRKRSRFSDSIKWRSSNLDHPSTFETLAMEPELKKTIIEDLERFMTKEEFYKKVGKAWKRGYLLYGPPGTGKSSLIAAMANYLNFNIYDLQLSTVEDDADLKKTLLGTTNPSILVIEDIDCSVKVQNRENKEGEKSDSDSDSDDQVTKKSTTNFTLSGLLNVIDGLWSCCAHGSIIVFTTNYKERLDPALLRPGRMDMHIHMSYCTPGGFRVLC